MEEHPVNYSEARTREAMTVLQTATAQANAGDPEGAVAFLHQHLDTVLDSNVLFSVKQLFMDLLQGINRKRVAGVPWAEQPARLLGGELDFIVQAALARTGSTVVWQILADLFPDRVVKAHAFPVLPQPVVITVRDFRDVVLSRCGVAFHRQGDALADRLLQVDADTLRDEARYVAEHERRMRRAMRLYEHMGNALVLYYETFFDDLTPVFDALEGFFGLTIDPRRRERLAATFSLAQNRAESERLRDFAVYDNKTQVHGAHVFDGRPGRWAEYLPAVAHDIFEAELRPALEAWGYA